MKYQNRKKNFNTLLANDSSTLLWFEGLYRLTEPKPPAQAFFKRSGSRSKNLNESLAGDIIRESWNRSQNLAGAVLYFQLEPEAQNRLLNTALVKTMHVCIVLYQVQCFTSCRYCPIIEFDNIRPITLKR